MTTAKSPPTLLLLPPPEPPFLPLSTSTLHKLTILPRTHAFPKLLATISSTLSTLAASASSLAAAADDDTGTSSLSASKQAMLIALDQTARATVDQARTVEAMRDVLASVLGGAREDAREARRRRRRRRLRAAAGGGEEGKREGGKKEKDEEEEYRVAGAVGDGVAGRYEVEFGRWEGEYEALDLWTKYTKSPEYKSFRSTLHPSTSGSGNEGEGGEGVEGDTWFPEAFEVCPLTLRPIEDRVTSKTCGHAFEKKAVMALLYGVGQARCPAAGCGKALSGDVLVGEREGEGEGEGEGEKEE